MHFNCSKLSFSSMWMDTLGRKTKYYSSNYAVNLKTTPEGEHVPCTLVSSNGVANINNYPLRFMTSFQKNPQFLQHQFALLDTLNIFKNT